jgi:hypothetical protein
MKIWLILVYRPTAMQKFALRQSTLETSLLNASDGGEIAWGAHVLPFQRCAIAVFTPPTIAYPTAVQTLVPEGQDSPVRAVELAPGTS